MKSRILMLLTAIALLAALAVPVRLAAQSGAQDNISNQLSRSPKLRGKTGKAHKAKPAAAAYSYQVLYSFCSASGCTDGYFPEVGLVRDAAGNLYGTTTFGGNSNSNCTPYGTCGTVFELGNTGQETVFYSFCSVVVNGVCTDGYYPDAGLIQDASGNLYGTTYLGGTWSGTVFELNSSGQETVLYSFCPSGGAGCTDAFGPNGGLLRDAEGNFYGTTSEGGKGSGAVFELDSSGQETVLYRFCPSGQSGCTDGLSPYAGLIQDTAGNLYGTTEFGGANTSVGNGLGGGTVFKLAPPAQQGGAWTETVLYSFCSAANCTDGEYPSAGLIQDAAGNLYGTTFYGGIYPSSSCPSNKWNEGCGTAFELAPPAQQGGTWTETILYNFCSVVVNGSCKDGQNPFAGLIQDAEGNFYGTTTGGGGVVGYPEGTVFELAPPAQQGGTWTETILYNLCSVVVNNICTDGAEPFAGLIQDTAGNLYGTTTGGGNSNSACGTSGCGTVFKLVAPPTPTVTVTPSSSSITTAQTLSVTVAVSGGSGNPTPTGTVTLTSGTYSSGATTLTSGSATITIPAGSLAVGTDTLTATYSGDSNYNPATGSNTVTVTAATPSFTITTTAVSVSPGATTGNTSTITVTPSGGFTGSVTLTAAVTSSPTGAQDPPTFNFGSTSPVNITGASAVTATLTISTTAPMKAALTYPVRPGARWHTANAATLAFVLLFGIAIAIPARERSWRTRLGPLVLLAVLAGGLLACGSSGNLFNPGTTKGAYTVTVTGTSGSTTTTGTVTLTVQ